MKSRSALLLAATALIVVTAVYAGTGMTFKCTAASGADRPMCDFESEVVFGGGMFFEQVTAYCVACEQFVYISWTRENLPEEMTANGNIKIVPKPKPRGRVWDARTGQFSTIHACPKCKGAVAQISTQADLVHCPKCNRAGFEPDKSKPMIAID